MRRGALVMAAWMALAAPAHADTDARARALGELGLNLFSDGKWQDAYEQFAKAEALRHAPTLVLYMAHCQKNLGHMLEAERLYRRVQDDALPSNASVQFQMAKEQAKSELAALRPRIPTLRVVADEAIRIDGKAVTRAEVRVDPGDHAVEGVVAGRRVSKPVRVDEGGRVVVDLRQPEAKSEPEESVTNPMMLVGGVVALGVGAAAAIVGGVTGGIALSRTNDIKSRCNGTDCLPEDAAAADDANTFATVSTVSFVVAAVGIPVGITLVVLGSGAASSATAVHVSLGGKF